MQMSLRFPCKTKNRGPLCIAQEAPPTSVLQQSCKWWEMHAHTTRRRCIAYKWLGWGSRRCISLSAGWLAGCLARSRPPATPSIQACTCSHIANLPLSWSTFHLLTFCSRFLPSASPLLRLIYWSKSQMYRYVFLSRARNCPCQFPRSRRVKCRGGISLFLSEHSILNPERNFPTPYLKHSHPCLYSHLANLKFRRAQYFSDKFNILLAN